MGFWLPLSPCYLLSIVFFSLIKEKKDQEFGANQMDSSWVRLVHQTEKKILVQISIIFII